MALSVWGLGALLYVIGFFHRVAPAVLTSELMAEFSLTAAALGNLSAVYFYSYVAMQIPTGVLADHGGPRRVLAAGAAIAAAGTLLFALAHSLALVALGRLLIGASVGVAFVAMLKLSTHWFPASRFALFSGIALACGIVGRSLRERHCGCWSMHLGGAASGSRRERSRPLSPCSTG